MTTIPPDGHEFVRSVERQADRRRKGREPGVWQGLARVGTVGWMVALPAVGGAFLGRWIDGRVGTGVSWTLSLLALGLVLGCAATWRSLNRELRG